MSKHTPGPWFAEPQFGTGGVDCGFDILQVRAPDDYEYRGCVARVFDAEHIDGITKAESDANARLIAAAPELLEALLLVARSAFLPTVGTTRAAVEKAIRKATEET